MPRIPTGTYRLQLHAGFGFDAAAEIADYIEKLGISHVYSSPYLQAAPGSQHGYDVVDHHKVNDELGGSLAHERFSLKLGACNLGQVLDIVPNHMAISGRRNRLWWDVLENGPSSRYSIYFDIDWQSHDERLRNKLLVPILGDHYGRVIARGEIKVKRRGGEIYIEYFEHELPASPRSVGPLLAFAARESGSDYLAFLADSLSRLPGPTLVDRASVSERHRDKEVIRGLLCRLFEETPFIGDAVDTALDELNRDADELDQFLEEQNYRLASWRTSSEELPYRRFFDVDTLVGLRMELPLVFADTHAMILRWLREGVLDGIRIDHPDGLRDPRHYFEWLRKDAVDVWIVAEKILEPGERFRAEWPINGTTGYDFLNEAAGLLVDRSAEGAITAIYADFTGETASYAEICRDKKHRVLRELLGSDVNRITTLLRDICEEHRERRDYTREDLIKAIRELTACFPVYRTYVVPERGEITPDDERYVNEAVDTAKRNRAELDADLFDFIRDILLLRVRGDLESEFVMRFQQFTGPAMAKGVEDTVFYCYNRLIALNEVGGSPGRFGVLPEEFHAFCQRAQESHPLTMASSSTHDTKRSEDVRARISLLSEMPQLWKDRLYCWSAMNEKYRKYEGPDRNTEYFLYQTMIGAWPIGTDRLLPYMEKATREAKQRTSWLAPNEQFENATRSFIEGIYGNAEFIQDFEAFVNRMVLPGQVSSLSQLLWKLTAPGVPDTYQGTELWDLSLVDPDNRRPVDYGRRRRLLQEMESLNVQAVWKRVDEGLPKLWTLHHVLRVRRERAELLGTAGTYRPLYALGPKAAHIVAFARGESVVSIAPRLVWTLDPCAWGCTGRPDWADTSVSLPAGVWKDELSGARVAGGERPLAEILKDFPVSLLTKT
ncbi:MAG: malto-oligosyltrehalose synthase [Acidobacteriaceae bacterium]|nr:malto-oligosyltrehalose synthase [Acidobacteriaceae bacterium]MBV8571215.1 malto-oligosyltrehalose synthase [Acidobacteriaceae bacterium]